MHCSPNFEKGLFGTLFFAGFLVSCAIFPLMAERYGRKIFVIIVTLLQAICYTLMLTFPNINLYLAMNFAIGLSAPLKGMIAYTHLMEWIPGKERLSTKLFFVYDGLISVICPLLLLYFTKNSINFIRIGLAINIIAMDFFCFVFFPESPIYLLETGKWE